MAESRAGDSAADSSFGGHRGFLNVSEMHEDALAEITSRLRKKPGNILPVLQIIRRDRGELQNTAKKAKIDETESFHHTLMTLGRISKEFLTDVLVEGSEGALTKTLLTSLERNHGDKKIIYDLVWMGTGLNHDTKWTKAGHVKAVLRRALL